VKLRPAVVAELQARGIGVAPDDTPATLRERLNDAYLEDVRHLRERQRRGEIPLADYAREVEALKLSYPLLALRLELWTT
jgi:hypothetical protein